MPSKASRSPAQGKFAHGLHVEERFDGRGNQYFWLAYRRGKGTLTAGTDIHAIGEGAISVTRAPARSHRP